MKKSLLCLLALPLAGWIANPVAAAADIPLGYISYDLTTPPGEAEFDIFNQTGPNSSVFPDTTWPVSTSVTLSNLTLTVMYSGGGTHTFTPGYFTVQPDGLSLDGTPLSTAANPPAGLAGAIGATLTGTFDETALTLNDGTTVTIDPSFSAVISDPGGLTDGDFAVIFASPASGGGGGSAVPEPGSLFLVGTGLASLAGLRRRYLGAVARKCTGAAATGALVLVACLGSASASASTTVRLNTWTSPASGASGSTFVSLSGSGFPNGTISPSAVHITLATSCGGPTAATATASSVTPIIGSSDRVAFEVPALLATGTYFVSMTGMNTGGTTFASSNCSEINVTHTSTALAACLPSSSLAVLTGTHVTAYVPKGAWSFGTTGISIVPIEGSGSSSTIATTERVNSCSSNSQTGETICVDNGTNVYELTGSALTHTLTSGSTGLAGFSGGSCENCGVAVNALTNTAVIAMGDSTSPSGDALQTLDLATNTFSPVFPTAFEVSENVSIDPNRSLILSPDEQNNYELYKISPSGALTEYHRAIGTAGEPDSAAEDCTTGIALSSVEFTGNLYITDLTQATFTAPSGGLTYGTWTAPGQEVVFPEFAGFAAGTDGISVAAGTTHLGIVTGEFGGNSFGVFQLPATSGTGTPSFVDYAAAIMPPTPDDRIFQAGFDPHTITAYTSPNNGKAYGLLADWETGVPTYVGVVDLQALLSAPRTAGTHNVQPSYDLLAHGVVRYVAVP